MKRKTIFIALAVGGIIIAALTAGVQEPSFRTALTPNGQGIVRHPEPLDIRRFQGAELKDLPAFDPSSNKGWQVDLRSRDISPLDLGGRVKDLLYADFDSRTIWPKNLPDGFDPVRTMELGKNPGLGIRKLHASGITGKGVGIAIIDQALLVDHIEYKDRLRLYEEIHCGDNAASMHGPAVASIALGKTVGVAPEAELYFIAETHGTAESGQFVYDFSYLAQSIDRILDVDKGLPDHRKICVLSISVGWDSRQKGYAEVTAAVERAQKEGIFVVSSSIFNTYEGKFYFHGLGRDPLADPDQFESYRPGLWWRDAFYSGKYRPASIPDVLLVPMDSRCTAGPTGTGDYAFYRQGGWSWSIPYIAGLYALACQIKPGITPATFWEAAIKSGDAVDFPARRAMPSETELAREIGKLLDIKIAQLKQQSGAIPLEKAMATVYNRMTGKKFETISEADFRAWSSAGPVREEVLGDTKPQTLKTIINPGRLIEQLKKR